jgi:hypothetical protein
MRSFRKLLCVVLVIFYTTSAWICLFDSQVIAQPLPSHVGNLTISPKEFQQLIEDRLNSKIQKAKLFAQESAEADARVGFNHWIDHFNSRLDSSGFFDWYFSYVVNRSTEDQQLLCSISHSIFPSFFRSRDNCDIFIQESRSQLISKVLSPIESEVDDINEKALGVFYDKLSRCLKSELKELRSDYSYQELPRAKWQEIERKLASIVPGFRGESVPAPPPFYLSAILTGREGELRLEGELGSLFFQIPSRFRSGSDSASEIKAEVSSDKPKVRGRQNYESQPRSPKSNRNLPPEKFLRNAAPQISEMEQLGFETTKLASLVEKGAILGTDLVKLHAVADPLVWVPIILLEGKRYWDLSSSKEKGVASLRKELVDYLTEQTNDLIQNDHIGLRAVLRRINLETISLQLNYELHK